MRIGLVGCGRWGANILRDLVVLGAEVVVVDVDPTIVLDGAASISTDPSTLTDVTGVVIATPCTTHAEVIERLLDLDVPLFVEKPFTTETDAALRLADRAPHSIFIMDKWRYHPAIAMLRDLVADGRLGALTRIETVRVQHGMPHTDVDCTWILLPHDLSIAVEVTGRRPVPRAVVGRFGNDGLVGVEIEFELGGGATMHTNVGVDAAETIRSIRVIGDRATAEFGDGWSDHLLLTDHDAPDHVERIDTPGELPLRAELAEFLEHLRGGPSPKSSVADGVWSVATIDTIRRMAMEAVR